MSAREKTVISFQEIMNADVLNNLHSTKQFAELKDLAWRKKKLTVEDILSLTHHDRFEFPSVGGFHAPLRERFLAKAKRIVKKKIHLVRARELVHPKFVRLCMQFELSHLDLLRAEPTFAINLEVYKKQNEIAEWPKTLGRDCFKFGWIIYWIDLNGTINITEIQSPVEMINITDGGESHYFIEQMNWTGFMLQQFIQHYTLRGFTRFTIPTKEKRLSHTMNKKLVESYYRDLPKAFGFSKRADGWYWLDFNR